MEVKLNNVETMKKIVESGEIDFLSKERLWSELSEAFNSKNPWMFFQALIDINFSKFYCFRILSYFYAIYHIHYTFSIFHYFNFAALMNEQNKG